MTTDLHIVRASNLFVDNMVYCLRRDGPLAAIELSGAAWHTKGIDPKKAHEIAIRAIIRLARSKLPEYGYCLLACHSTWQPSNQITRYNKFWKSLKKGQGVEMPPGRECTEGLVETDGQLKYFSGIMLERSDEAVVAALPVIHEERASAIVVMPPQSTEVIDGLVTSGWPAPEFSRPSKEILAKITMHNGIVLHPVGAFDDFEAGMVAIAYQSTIQRLLGNGGT